MNVSSRIWEDFRYIAYIRYLFLYVSNHYYLGKTQINEMVKKK